MAITLEKQQLIEEVGLRLESSLNIAPLAARIYALLSVSSSEGLTFDEIREAIGSSKSSTSVNINVLQQLKHIDYYTKPGDRKRYFRIVHYFQLTTLEAQYHALENDIKLIEKIKDFNEIHHPMKFEDELSLGNITISYLKQMQSLITETVSKMKANSVSKK